MFAGIFFRSQVKGNKQAIVEWVIRGLYAVGSFVLWQVKASVGLGPYILKYLSTLGGWVGGGRQKGKADSDKLAERSYRELLQVFMRDHLRGSSSLHSTLSPLRADL
jgi:hypothetical protein